MTSVATIRFGWHRNMLCKRHIGQMYILRRIHYNSNYHSHFFVTWEKFGIWQRKPLARNPWMVRRKSILCNDPPERLSLSLARSPLDVISARRGEVHSGTESTKNGSKQSPRGVIRWNPRDGIGSRVLFAGPTLGVPLGAGTVFQCYCHGDLRDLSTQYFREKGIARYLGINLFETRSLEEAFFRIQFWNLNVRHFGGHKSHLDRPLEKKSD